MINSEIKKELIIPLNNFDFENNTNNLSTNDKISIISDKPFKKPQNKLLAISLNLLSYLFFTSVIFCHRYISINFPHLTPDLQNFIRSIVAFSCSIFGCYYNNITIWDCFSKAGSFRGKPFIIRIFSGSITPFFLTGMGNNLRLSTSLTLINLQPIVIAASATYFLNEVFSQGDLISLLFCLTGCFMITKPFSSKNQNGAQDHFIGLIYAVCCLASRTAVFISQKIVGEKIEVTVTLFYVLGVNVILSSLKFLLFGETREGVSNLNIIGSFSEFLWLGVIGIIFWVTGLILMTSLNYAPLVFLQPFATSSILFSFLLSWIFLNETYDAYDYLGATLILGTNIIRSLHSYYEYLEKENEKKIIKSNELDIFKPSI